MGLIPPLRLALAQIDSSVGDLEGNSAKIAEQIAAARDAGAELVALPRAGADRLPARGPAAQGALRCRPHRGRRRASSREAQGIVAIVGFADRDDDVYNAAAVIAEGEVRPSTTSTILPNYGVFDEQRYFQAGRAAAP